MPRVAKRIYMQCSVAWVLYADWDGSMPKQPNVRL